MKKAKLILQFFLFYMAIQLLLASNSFAYLDPATGSMIFQAIIAALVGTGVVVKLYWYRLKALFFRKSKPSDIMAAA